jgi:hypothetical protein
VKGGELLVGEKYGSLGFKVRCNVKTLLVLLAIDTSPSCYPRRYILLVLFFFPVAKKNHHCLFSWLQTSEYMNMIKRDIHQRSACDPFHEVESASVQLEKAWDTFAMGLWWPSTGTRTGRYGNSLGLCISNLLIGGAHPRCNFASKGYI